MAQSSFYDVLKELPMFQGISTEQLTHILEVIPFDFRTYTRGEVISRGGELVGGATFLLSGEVLLETPIFNHRVKIEQRFQAPYTFSLHHLFGAEMTARSTMIAASERTGLMTLSKNDFLRILHENEIALINVMNMLCTRAQKQHKAIDFSGETDPVLRLASWLLAFTERSATEVCAIAPQEDWCDMLQLDVPAFWRCVATLEGQKILDSEDGRLKLLDRYGLKSLVANKTAQKV